MSPEQADDLGLIARVRLRDVDAFELLYKSYHPRLVRFISYIVHHPTLVEEVLNDTMIVVWNAADSFRGDSKVSTWVFGIAYRKAAKALRRLDLPIGEGVHDERSSPDDSPEQSAANGSANAALHKAIMRLSPNHRAVVDLTYFHGRGYREIAEIMDCPVDTVKTRMFHARRHLKAALAGVLADWI